MPALREKRIQLRSLIRSGAGAWGRAASVCVPKSSRPACAWPASGNGWRARKSCGRWRASHRSFPRRARWPKSARCARRPGRAWPDWHAREGFLTQANEQFGNGNLDLARPRRRRRTATTLWSGRQSLPDPACAAKRSCRSARGRWCRKRGRRCGYKPAVVHGGAAADALQCLAQLFAGVGLAAAVVEQGPGALRPGHPFRPLSGVRRSC